MMMYPVLQDIVVTRVLNDTNTTVTMISIIDPYTVLVLAVFAFVTTVVGFVFRGAIVNAVAFVLCIIDGIVYANGFVYYDPGSNVLVFYQSIPVAFVFITLAVVNIIAFFYKILTVEVVKRRPW